MNHVVVIRFHYPENDLRFKWRFEYFRKEVLPRLIQQTDQNFDIAIWCESWHKKLFEDLSNKIIVFDIKPEKKGYIRYSDRKRAKSYGGKFFIDFTQWENVIGLEKYDIQTALDSDDLVSKDYIARIKKECSRVDSSLHITFQPKKLFVDKGIEKTHNVIYNTMKGSMFYSIYQPDKSNYLFVYHDSHLVIGKYMKKSIYIPECYCWQSIHKYNESTE